MLRKAFSRFGLLGLPGDIGLLWGILLGGISLVAAALTWLVETVREFPPLLVLVAAFGVFFATYAALALATKGVFAAYRSARIRWFQPSESIAGTGANAAEEGVYVSEGEDWRGQYFTSIVARGIYLQRCVIASFLQHSLTRIDAPADFIDFGVKINNETEFTIAITQMRSESRIVYVKRIGDGGQLDRPELFKPITSLPPHQEAHLTIRQSLAQHMVNEFNIRQPEPLIFNFRSLRLVIEVTEPVDAGIASVDLVLPDEQEVSVPEAWSIPRF